MKLRWYDSILISLGGLLLMALGVCILLAAGGVISLPEPLALDVWLGEGWQWLPLVFLCGLLVIAWGTWLFVRPWMRKRDRSGKYYTLQDGEGGVEISVQAIEHLVRKALSVWPEILSTQIKIGGQENAMHISLRAVLCADVRIPELIGDVRGEIKQYIEECAGVKVESVRVVIEQTKDEHSAPRREPRVSAKSVPQIPEAVKEPYVAAEPLPTQPERPEIKRGAFLLEPEEPRQPVVLGDDIDMDPAMLFPDSLSGDAFSFPEEAIALEEEADAGQVAEEAHTEEDMPDA